MASHDLAEDVERSTVLSAQHPTACSVAWEAGDMAAACLVG